MPKACRETVADMRHEVIDDLVARYIPENAYAEQWDVGRPASEGVRRILNLDLPIEDWAKEEGIAEDEIRERLTEAADEAAADRAERFGPDIMAYVERSVVLQTLDHLWREHIVNLDHLRSVIGFRGYAQRDPLNEYKGEAFELFQAHARQSAPGRDRAADARRAGPRGGRGAAAARRRRCTATISTAPPARTISATAALTVRQDTRRDRAARGARPEEPGDLGQGRPQRALPLRLGQEIQALPRRFRLSWEAADAATIRLGTFLIIVQYVQQGQRSACLAVRAPGDA